MEGYLVVDKMSVEFKREDWVVFIRLFKIVIFCLWDIEVYFVKILELLN